jgi:hypothetical protein
MEYSFHTLPLSDILKQAQKKDQLFITRFTKTESDNRALRKFKIIHHEDPLQKGKRYRIVQADDNAEVQDDDTEVVQAQDPKLLECTIYGEIQFLEAGPYGNWVPKGENNPYEIMYPTEDINRATVFLVVDAHTVIADSLKVIDDAMEEFLSNTDGAVSNYNKLVRKDRVTVKYPLVVPIDDWQEENKDKSKWDF